MTFDEWYNDQVYDIEAIDFVYHGQVGYLLEKCWEAATKAEAEKYANAILKGMNNG